MRALLLILFTLLCLPSAAQSVNANVLRLAPSTVPVTCNDGDLRVDKGDSDKFKMCLSNVWAEVTPTGTLINPMTTNGDLITQTAGVPARLALGTVGTVLTSLGTAPSWAKLLNINIDSAAAIAYSKLVLTGDIVNSDVSPAAAIAYGKLNLTGSIVNADVASGAAIVDTKLATISSTGKVSNSATTAVSTNTNSAIVTRDGSGNFAAGTITANLTGAVTGNASTATALAANPTDCSATNFATAIDASGNLTCAIPAINSTSGILSTAKGGTGADFSGSTGILKDASGTMSVSTIVDADINSSAAISRGKIATGTPISVVINGTFGELGSTTVLGTGLGGTNNAALATTAGGMLYTDGSKFVNMGAGTAGQVPVSTGAGAPIWGNTVGGNFANLIIGDFSNSGAGWTASGGTFATVTTGTNFIGVGSQNGTWDSSAAGQTLTSPAYTISSGYAGTNGLWRCKVQNPTAATITMGRWDGTTLTDAIAIDPGTTAKYVEIADSFGAAATTTAIRFTSVASNEPLIAIADCYIGLNFNLSSVNVITDWQNFPSLTSGGTIASPGSNLISAATTAPTLSTSPTVHTAQWRRVGGNMEIRWNYVAAGSTGASGGSGQYVLNLPPGYSMDLGRVKFNTGANVYQNGSSSLGTYTYADTSTGINGDVSAYSATQLRMDGGGSGGSTGYLQWASGANQFDSSVPQKWSAYASVPIAGWTASNAVRADNSNYGPTAYTPTITGFGTNTNISFFQERKGSWLHVYGTFTSGTTSASLASISLPGTLALNTSMISIQNTTSNPGMMAPGGGYEQSEANANTRGVMVTAPATSTALVYFGCSEVNSSSAITPCAGTGVTAAGVVNTVDFWAPISGWTENQSTPMLINTVFSSSGGQERIERASVASNGAITSQSGDWLTGACVVTDTSFYTCPVKAGYFSSMPACNMTINTTDGTVLVGNLVSASTTTSLQIRFYTLGVSKGAVPFEIICMGPR